MARLCILMSVFAFGLSFAPSILNGATDAPEAQIPPPSNADRFAACAADCRACAMDAREHDDPECVRLCQKCEQFCVVCADPTAVDCAALKAIAAQHLTACMKSCQNSEREACKRCVASCLNCLELCPVAN